MDDLLCGEKLFFAAGAEGRVGHEKKSFQGDTRRSGVAMNSFAICLSLR